MITEPTITERNQQTTAGIRAQLTMEEMGQGGITQLFDALFSELERHGVAADGPAFLRYHVIDMAAKLEIEAGVPVAPGFAGAGRLAVGTIPAGRYATVLYTGDYSGLMEANRVLVDWAKENAIAWDCHTTERGDHFAARFETYFNGPDTEPDPAKLETEVAIRLAAD